VKEITRLTDNQMSGRINSCFLFIFLKPAAKFRINSLFLYLNYVIKGYFDHKAMADNVDDARSF